MSIPTLAVAASFAAVLAEDLKPDSPGAVPPIAFAVTALFAIAVILLGLDLVRRIRRSQFKDEIRENLAAELAEHEQGDAQAGPADDTAGKG